MNPSFLRLGIVAGTMAVLVGVAAVVPSGSAAHERPRPARVPLTQASLVCPESSFVRSRTTTDVVAVTAGDAAPTGADVPDRPRPRLDLAGLGASEPLAAGERRGEAVSYAVRSGDVPPLVVTARRTMAPGLTAGQVTRSDAGPLRGLAETPCVAPGTEFWFVGAGSELGRHGRVYLTNVDPGPAQVDLRLYDENGPVSNDSLRTLAVPAREQVVVELDQVAPTSEHLAVAVVVTQGRVAAAVRDDAVKGETPVGVDWIPPTVPPAKELVVPGAAPGRGPRVLSLVAPGDSTASVDLSILSANGSFQPTELGHVEVPPGTVTQVRLDSVTQQQAAAVRVSSDVPVVATMRSDLGPADGPRDVAYAPATRALVGPAVVPLTTTGDKKSAVLLLATPARRAVHATATMLDPKGRELSSTRLVVKAGSSLAVPLKPPKNQPGYVLQVRSADGGPLYGVRFQMDDPKGGPMVSAWPLASAATTAVRPVSRSDPAAGVGEEESGDVLFGTG